ncbi:hypothetical protein B0H10DRAFT_1969194 [Mycena sp. CBHHK59/15]|nr:hypothetical protein B0H10DRAFT_1969194 [Mycena sp. CBHHK59/15]
MYIKLFGTTTTITEYTEHLHIDLAKDAFRSTNFKDEFPQMTLWLERKEKIFRHEEYIQWRLMDVQVEAESASIALPFNAVPVFHKIKYTTEDPYTADGPTDSEVDAIHVRPVNN